jgi:phage gp29-like protein
VASAVNGVDRRGAGTIGRLIAFNYGPVDPSKLPRLQHTGLDTDDLAESLGMLPALVQAGLLTPDNNLERAIRERLGAGELPEEAERAPIQRTAPSPVAALAEQLIKRRRDGSQG